jgi:hypothetical protein
MVSLITFIKALITFIKALIWDQVHWWIQFQAAKSKFKQIQI